MTPSVRTQVVVGADVLDIMSVAMYAEPLVIYRELIQNAADAVEAAIGAGDLKPGGGGVAFAFEPGTRTVSIVDNGSGLANDAFESQMLSFGASSKRTQHYRGFRGIGRLAGLGHCKELVFRSRARGDRFVREARWSSVRARELISMHEVVPIETLAHEVVTLREFRAAEEPAAFFEVRLEGVRRVADDRLFDARRIAEYLAEVAPVPFSAAFSRGPEIRFALLRWSPLLELRLTVGRTVVEKPYRDEIEARAGRTARISDIEYVELPAVDERAAAFGWIAHHDYLGALRPDSPGRGLRVRSGNLQIGDHTLLARAFPEERFNAWAVGELHVFDGRLRANARRDAFEPSPHVDNLYNQLAPYAAAIARRCRQQSKSRNDGRRANSLATTFDALEAVLGRDASPFAAAVRQMVGIKACQQLKALVAEGGSAPPELRELERRAASLARRRSSKRLSPREQGRVDVLRWLYDKGDVPLFATAVAALKKER